MKMYTDTHTTHTIARARTHTIHIHTCVCHTQVNNRTEAEIILYKR